MRTTRVQVLQTGNFIELLHLIASRNVNLASCLVTSTVFSGTSNSGEVFFCAKTHEDLQPQQDGAREAFITDPHISRETETHKTEGSE